MYATCCCSMAPHHANGAFAHIQAASGDLGIPGVTQVQGRILKEEKLRLLPGWMSSSYMIISAQFILPVGHILSIIWRSLTLVDLTIYFFILSLFSLINSFNFVIKPGLIQGMTGWTPRLACWSWSWEGIICMVLLSAFKLRCLEIDLVQLSEMDWGLFYVLYVLLILILLSFKFRCRMCLQFCGLNLHLAIDQTPHLHLALILFWLLTQWVLFFSSSPTPCILIALLELDLGWMNLYHSFLLRLAFSHLRRLQAILFCMGRCLHYWAVLWSLWLFGRFLLILALSYWWIPEEIVRVAEAGAVDGRMDNLFLWVVSFARLAGVICRVETSWKA